MYPTVQSAIDASENGDEIVLSAGTYNEAIDTLGKAVTIRSTNPKDPAVVDATVFDGTGLDTSIVRCRNEEGPATRFVGLTFSNGEGFDVAPGFDFPVGGAMYLQGAAPVIEGCRFVGNHALAGGAVRAVAASPLFRDCIFEGNGYDGDELFSQRGGAIAAQQSDAIIEGCLFIGNATMGNGGALELDRSTVAIRGCSFVENESGGGGAIVVSREDPVTIVGCEFLRNTARNGGAIRCQLGDVLLDSCVFEANSSERDGGACFFELTSASILGCDFVDQVASGDGGAIFTEGLLAIGEGQGLVTVFGCTFENNDGRFGGAVAMDGTQIVLTGCAFDLNSASVDGGAVSAEFGELTIESCTLLRSSAGRYGGAVAMLGNDARVSDTSFELGRATDDGGAVYAIGGHVEFDGCDVLINTTSGSGAAIAVLFGGEAEINGSTFFENSQGCVVLHDARCVIQKCEFDRLLGFGSVLRAHGRSEATVASCRIPTDGHSPGLALFGGASARLVQSEVFYAGSESFPFFFNEDSDLLAQNCTIVFRQSGSAVVLGDGVALNTFRNCVIATLQSGLPASFPALGVVVEHSIVPGGFPGVGNLDVDPMFVYSSMGDFRLAPGSPAIDAGDNGDVPADLLTDLDGLPRFVDDPNTPDTGVGTAPIVDMGAYEFQSASVCHGDCDGSGVVDFNDLVSMLFAFGDTTQACDADLNGMVDFNDLVAGLFLFGPCP